MKSSLVSRALLAAVVAVAAISFASAAPAGNARMEGAGVHAVSVVEGGMSLLHDAQVSPTVKSVQVAPSTPQLKGSAMNPSIGRTVIVKGLTSNGSNEHPAVVTRVWSPQCVNLTVFPDCASPFAASSVKFMETRAEALAYREAQGDAQPMVAFWPDRSA